MYGKRTLIGKIVDKKKIWLGHMMKGDACVVKRRDEGKDGGQENKRREEEEYVSGAND